MADSPKRPWWVRLLLSIAAGLASALLVAIAVAVIDLYLTARGLTPMNSPLLTWPAGDVHLSLADILFLGAAVLATAIAWRRTARRGG